MRFFVLVHPCDKESKGGCEQVCNKVGSKAECSCNEGYVLEKDLNGVELKTCKKGL